MKDKKIVVQLELYLSKNRSSLSVEEVALLEEVVKTLKETSEKPSKIVVAKIVSTFLRAYLIDALRDSFNDFF